MFVPNSYVRLFQVVCPNSVINFFQYLSLGTLEPLIPHLEKDLNTTDLIVGTENDFWPPLPSRYSPLAKNLAEPYLYLLLPWDFYWRHPIQRERNTCVNSNRVGCSTKFLGDSCNSFCYLYLFVFTETPGTSPDCPTDAK